MAKHFGVVGSPISHSLSPAIHNAAYQELGLDWDYEAFEVQAKGLGDFLVSSGSALSGISVTMPLKVEAAKLADVLDEASALLGVSNTLHKVKDVWHGANTDVFGMQMAIKDVTEQHFHSIAILGSGATAKSALYALKDSGARLTVYARDVSNSAQIETLAKALEVDAEISHYQDMSREHDLFINTTPTGSLGSLVLPKQAGWLLNVGYSSDAVDLLDSFDQDRIISGKNMLLWQAVAQIRLFLNGDYSVHLPKEDEVIEAMKAAL